MPLYLRLRRGTPVDVRQSDTDVWRPHVCASDTRLMFAERLAYADTAHWCWFRDGWQVRVCVPFLERDGEEAEDECWHLGVTGTREGLTAPQRAAFAAHLRDWLLFATRVPTVHIGGCVGADRAAHNIFRELWGRVCRVEVHPASDQPETLCDWTDADVLREPQPSLLRNRHIVDSIGEGSLLLAFPRGMREERRSGTWATVRVARKLGRGVLLFLPDGSVKG